MTDVLLADTPVGVLRRGDIAYYTWRGRFRTIQGHGRVRSVDEQGRWVNLTDQRYRARSIPLDALTRIEPPEFEHKPRRKR